MPDARTHDALIVISAPIVAVSAEAMVGSGMGIVAGVSHIIGGLFLSPDLDLPSASINERWGPLSWMWMLYDRLIPHRSIFSHSGISVFLRAGYLVLLAELALLILSVSGALNVAMVNAALLDVARAHPQAVVAVAAGLFASDAIHSLADGV